MPKSDQGVDFQRFQVIPRTLIFIFDGDLVLLLKGAHNKKIWAQRYNGLGGHVEAGEDINSAARRELFEEAGIVCKLQLCGTVMCDVEPTLGILLFVYRGEFSKPVLIPSDEGTLEWVAVNTIPSLPVVEDLPVLLEKLIPWKASDPVFSASNRYNSEEKLITTFYE